MVFFFSTVNTTVPRNAKWVESADLELDTEDLWVLKHHI